MWWLRHSWGEAFLTHRLPAHPGAVSPSQTTLPLPAQPSGGGGPGARMAGSPPPSREAGPDASRGHDRFLQGPAEDRPGRGGSSPGGGLGSVAGAAAGSLHTSLSERAFPAAAAWPGAPEERGRWFPPRDTPGELPVGWTLEDTVAKPGAAGQLLWGGREPAALGPGPRWPSRQGRVPVSTGTVARGAHDRSQRGAGAGSRPTILLT